MLTDRLIIEFDRALRTLAAPARSTRATPGHELPEAALDDSQRQEAIGLMRVNHCGEVCAQALYQGQALTSRQPAVRAALQQAADEETEHLAWTERRIEELGSRKSRLNPVWYAGALSFGIVAGKLGEGWSLGFLAETERQVESHLDGHLSRLPEGDARSQAVVRQMKLDEKEHADMAVRLGARELPGPVKTAMRMAAKVMTTTAYYL